MKAKGHYSTQMPPFSNAVRVNKVLPGETHPTIASLPQSPHRASCSLLIQRVGSFGATFKDSVMSTLPITIHSSSLCFGVSFYNSHSFPSTSLYNINLSCHFHLLICTPVILSLPTAKNTFIYLPAPPCISW